MKLKTMTIGATGLMCAAAAAQPTVANYTAIPIGLLPEAFSNVAWGLNNSGQVVGWNQGPAAIVRAYLWSAATGIQEIVPPPGFTESIAFDISDTGFVVGAANTGLGTNNAAWRWRDGQYTLIPTIPGQCVSMTPLAVNDSGALVGNTCDGSIGSVAFFYSDATGTMNLTPFGITYVQDINNAGVVTGIAFNGTKYTACRWQSPAGVVESLPTLPAPYDDSSRGEGINEAGQVVGVSVNVLVGSDHYRAFAGDPSGVFMVSNPVTARSSAYAINEQGHIVGTDGTTSTTDIYGWVWTPSGGKVFLSGTANGIDVWHVNRAVDINDAGQIIGSMSAPEIPGRAVLLTPIGGPQPCYANCDGSTAVPVLTANDFACFLNRYAAGESYANCDSTGGLTANDFQCFLNRYVEGCS